MVHFDPTDRVPQYDSRYSAGMRDAVEAVLGRRPGARVIQIGMIARESAQGQTVLVERLEGDEIARPGAAVGPYDSGCGRQSAQHSCVEHERDAGIAGAAEQGVSRQAAVAVDGTVIRVHGI